MSEMTTATTTITVEIRGWRARIEDVRSALNVLASEGVPESSEVSIYQRTERVPDEGVAYKDQRTEDVLTVRAERAAKGPAS